MEFGVLGPLVVRTEDGEISIGGAKRRALLALLLLNANRVVAAERLIEDLWEGEPPDTAPSTLQSHVYNLRRALGPDRLHTKGNGYVLEVGDGELDAALFEAELTQGRNALTTGDAEAAADILTTALSRWRGSAYDEVAGASWVTAEAARLEESRAVALESLLEARLSVGAHAEVVGRAEAAVAEFPLRERLWAQLMLALYREGRQAEALRAYQRVRTLLGEELGIEPGPELRAMEQAVLAQDASLGAPSNPAAAASVERPALPSGVVTFLLTDIVGSTRLWETAGAAMPEALRRHDELMSATVAGHDGVLLKARGEGDSTFSVFRRASDGAAAAIDAQSRLRAEMWPEACQIAVRMALHTGEAFERDGDFFGPALNRAARLRSVAVGGQVLVSQATAELVRDHLQPGTVLRSLGQRALRDLSRDEHVFELGSADAETVEAPVPEAAPALTRPPFPAPLAVTGVFVGREDELAELTQQWEVTTAGSALAAVIGGEPGVGKTRLAAEMARRVHDRGSVVLYGRCDEDLGAPYQPFAEAFRSLLPGLGGGRLQALRGVEELGRLVPEVADLVSDLGPPTRGDPDTERYALFDAVTRLLVSVATDVPVLVVLDDLQWASKPTLLLMRHVLRNAESARLQLIATYRTTDLDPAHPLAATLADLHRDATATRVVLTGLGESEVTAYLDAAGYEDEELASTLASVTSGNPFFLIEVLRHLDETGGRWDPSTLPQGVREAVGRRLARLSSDANDALLAGAVVGGRFALDVVERVVGRDLVEAVTEACEAELVVEEPGGWFRFNHAIVRRSLLVSVASVKRVRLHQRIAEVLEATGRLDDSDALAELAHHYFESAWAGNAAKAVEYCRRAGDQAAADVAYEAAADLYDRALQAMDIDDRPADDGERAELLLARCEALLSAGDVGSATDAVARLEEAATGSPRLAAWATCFAAQLAVLVHPDQLDTIEGAVAAAAEQLAELDDAAGEAKAHTVRASCLARLGRHADCETALDRALTAARHAGDHRRVNAVLAGAPLAALWGPSPVARAGGRCLDVVRLLRITTGSPAVEAVSTRCQAVLEAFRGRAHAARRMLESARTTLTELGLRHARLEVDLFAGVVELVDGNTADARPSLERAFAGFRRMGVDADAAQAAALLARAYVELGEDAKADQLCAESQRLAGHDLKASIAWRAVRAQLQSRGGEHARARELAEAAVAIAERTDALVDHGDACMALATVLGAAGDVAGARRASESAATLYERKGAVALVERARQAFEQAVPSTPAAREQASSATPAYLNNAAARFAERGFQWALAGEWEQFGTGTDENVVFEDRRPGLGTRVEGRDAFVAMMQTGFALGMTGGTRVPIATRGEGLLLARAMYGTAGFETEMLDVSEYDSDGRLLSICLFDPADLDAAFAELDARYLGGAASPHADTFRTLAQSIVNAAALDVSALAPDVSVVDHRLVPILTATDRASFASIMESAFSDLSNTTTHMVAVHALYERGGVFTVTARAATAEGAPVELVFTLVQIVESGLVSRVEVFAEDALDIALSRFAELATPQGSDLLMNDAARGMAQIVDAFLRRDWDDVSGMIAPDAVLDDRRPVMTYRYEGRDAYVSFLQSVAQVGVTGFDTIPVATRGERLVLSRNVVRVGDFEAESLNVAEFDSDGKAVAGVSFDSDDLDAAFAELDARFMAGEAAPYAEVFRAMVGGTEAYNLRTRDHPMVHPDLVMVDRQRLSLMGGDDVRAYRWAVRDIYETAPDIASRMTAVHALDDGGGVVTIESEGTSREGVPVAYLVHIIQLVEAGRVTRVEIFSENDLELALARLTELRVRVSVENAATRWHRRWLELFAEQRWDAMDATYVDDLLNDDRRSGVRHLGRGREALTEYVRAGRIPPGARLESTFLATRGDRLSLARSRYRDPDPAPGAPEVEMIVVDECAEDGRLVARVTFDASDLDAAFAELDARYLAGEAAPRAEVFGAMAGAVEAYNVRQREHPNVDADLAYVDQRRLPIWPLDDVSSYRAWVRSSYDAVPDQRARITAVHALDAAGGVITVVTSGTTLDGAPVEYVTPVVQLVEAGRVTRVETFSETDLELALARFAELHTSAANLLMNDAARRITELVDAIVRRDWEEVAATMAPHAVYDERRSLVTHRYEGRDAYLSYLQSVAELGVTGNDTIVIATRGERLVLTRSVVRGERYEVEALGVGEFDADGKAVAGVTFDPDDLDAAFAELDTRFLAGEAAPFASEWALATAGFDAFNRRDWSTLGGLVTADYRLYDHRPASFGDQDQAGFLANVRGVVDQVPDATFRFVAVPRLTAGGGVYVARMSGHDGYGGVVEYEWVMVEVADDRVKQRRRTELFSIEQLPAALARLDELIAPPAPVLLTNQAARGVARIVEAVLGHDWGRVGEMIAPDVLFDDRRSVMTYRYEGRDAYLSFQQATAQLGETELDVIPVATRGELLFLSRNVARGASFEVESLSVAEFGSDGKEVAAVTLDPDDLEAAFAELDTRYLAHEGAQYAETLRPIFECMATYNARDWDRYRSLLADDLLLVDHRPASLGTIRDPDEAARAFRAMVDLAGRLTARTVAVLAVDHGTATLAFELERTTVDGGAIDLGASYSTFAVSDGRVSVFEIFASDGMEAAIARFEELRRTPDPLENAATSAIRRRHASIVSRDGHSADLFAADAVVHDRRRGVLHTLRGREEIAAGERAAQRIGMSRIDDDVLAVRGERLALLHTCGGGSDRSAGAFEGHLLEVVEVDDAGRITRAVVYDEDAGDAAFDELEALYLGCEAQPFAATWRSIVNSVATLNRQGALSLPESYKGVDHRPLPLPEGDMGSWAPLGAVGDVRMRVTEVLRLENHGAVTRFITEGTTSEGAGASWEMVAVITVGSHGRTEIFPEEDTDAAIARFEQLRPAGHVPANAASQARRLFGELILARDWDAVADLLAEDAVVEDLRPGVRHTYRGRSAIVDNARAVAATRVTSMDSTAVAIRGARLSLCTHRASGSGPGAYEAAALIVTEVDARGRTTFEAVFGEGEYHEAFAVLEDRYLKGEAAPYAEIWQNILDGVARLNRDDPLAMPAGMEFVDHRPASFGTHDPKDAISVMGTVVEGSVARVVAAHRLDSHGAVFTIAREGKTPDGFEARWSMILVSIGVGERAEVFDGDQLDAALARFEELRPTSLPLDNAASRAQQRRLDLIVRRQWDALIELLAEDVVHEDRRRGVHHTVRGREEAVAYDRGVADMGVTYVETKVIATRGDRLALTYVQGGGRDRGRPEAYEGDALLLNEVDAAGRILYAIGFDPDALEAAHDELDARYLAGEASPFADVWRREMGAIKAINRGDLSALRDVPMVDHSRTWLPAGDPASGLRPLVDLGIDVTIRITCVHGLDGRGAAYSVSMEGADDGGVRAEWSHIGVSTAERVDIFSESQLAEALALFSNLPGPKARQENAASRARRRSYDLLVEQEWDALAELFADDAVVEDRRSGVRCVLHGRQEIVTYDQTIAAMGVTYVETRVVATRGDRLALSYIRGGGRDRGRLEAYEGDALALTEVDADGRVVFAANFDGDALEIAYSELETRYLAGEAAPHAKVWQPIVDSFAAINRHDLDALSELVLVDHTRQWLPTGDFTVSMPTLLELVPDLTMRVPIVYRLDTRGAVFGHVMEGTNQDGGHVSWSLVVVLDRNGRADSFPDDQLDTALAWFEKEAPT